MEIDMDIEPGQTAVRRVTHDRLYVVLQRAGEKIKTDFETQISSEIEGYNLEFQILNTPYGDAREHCTTTFFLTNSEHETHEDSAAFSSYGFSRTNGYITAQGLGVKSFVGVPKVGSTVFHLNLLLSILVGATHVELLNYTDDPSRAAAGIYGLFKINKRKGTTGVERAAFYGQKLPEQLATSEGAMIYTLTGDSLSLWAEHWERQGLLANETAQIFVKSGPSFGSMKNNFSPKTKTKQSRKKKKPKKPKNTKRKPKNTKRKKKPKKSKMR
jgi:hypothetical protein